MCGRGTGQEAPPSQGSCHSCKGSIDSYVDRVGSGSVNGDLVSLTPWQPEDNPKKKSRFLQLTHKLKRITKWSTGSTPPKDTLSPASPTSLSQAAAADEAVEDQLVRHPLESSECTIWGEDGCSPRWHGGWDEWQEDEGVALELDFNVAPAGFASPPEKYIHIHIPLDYVALSPPRSPTGTPSLCNDAVHAT